MKPAVFYAVGDVIEAMTFLGSSRFVRVETKEQDVKNGKPGFSGQEVNENGIRSRRDDSFSGVWGYDDQVLAVRKRSGAV